MAVYVGFSCFSVVETGNDLGKRGDGGAELAELVGELLSYV